LCNIIIFWFSVVELIAVLNSELGNLTIWKIVILVDWEELQLGTSGGASDKWHWELVVFTIVVSGDWLEEIVVEEVLGAMVSRVGVDLVGNTLGGGETDVLTIDLFRLVETEVVEVIELLGSPGGVSEGSISSVIEPLLVWIILDEVFEVSELEFTIIGLQVGSGKNQWVSLVIRLLPEEIHAGVISHGGGFWLSIIVSEYWGSVAIFDSELEIDVRVKWDWLTTNWWPGEGTTPGVVRWAWKLGNISLLELGNCKIEALPDFGLTDSEGLWSTILFGGGVGD
jgi:hypothetical protein